MRGKLNSGDHKMAQDKQAEIVRWLHSVAAASPVPPEVRLSAVTRNLRAIISCYGTSLISIHSMTSL